MVGPSNRPPAANNRLGPTLSDDQLQALAVQALAQLGFEPDTATRGTIFGPLTTGPTSVEYTVDMGYDPVGTSGQYGLDIACVGTGTETVRWSSTNGIVVLLDADNATGSAYAYRVAPVG